MATRTFQAYTAPRVGFEDVDYREFIQGFHDCFVMAGWVQTTDTGQVNPTTAVWPTTNGTYSHYEVWRMDDPVQGANPFFLRIEFGRHTSGPQFSVQLKPGRASDGAGNIVGATASSNSSAGMGLNLATKSDWICSGDTDRLVIMCDPYNSQARTGYWWMERGRRSDGTVDDDYTWVSHGAGVSIYSMMFPKIGASQAWSSSNLPGLFNPGTGTMTKGADVGVVPYTPNLIGPIRAPLVAAIGFAQQDINSATQFPVTIYGTQRNYIATRVGGSSYGWAAATAATYAYFAIRWE